MKKIIQLIILLYSLNSFTQTIVKVEPDESKNKYFSIYLLDENDIMSTLGFKDSNGFYNLKNIKLDSLKTYRLYLDDTRFLKIDEKLNLKRNDTLIVKLKLNPNCNCKNFSKNLLAMKCQFYDHRPYISKQVRSLAELPIMIVKKVQNYLKSRVGEKFYRKIYFKAGQIMDTTKYDKYFKNFKIASRYSYNLCFATSNIKKGIGEYTATIELNDFGNVINDINLPKENKDIIRLVSLKKIKKKAIVEKFYVEGQTKIEMNYDSSKNILVWKFINDDYKSNGIYFEKELTFNAHNGKRLELKTSTGTWVE